MDHIRRTFLITNKMKKLLLLIVLTLAATTAFTQSKFKLGLQVGDSITGSNIRTIDSLTLEGATLNHYIDGSAYGGSAYTFEDGLTESGGTVKLGGGVDETITIENTGSGITNIRGNDGVDRSASISLRTTRMELYTYQDASYNGSSGYQGIYLDDTDFLLLSNNGSNTNQFDFNETIIKITDNINSTGIEYHADYSINGLANDRWLPDIAAVRSEISDSIATVSGITGTGTATFIPVYATGGASIEDAAMYTTSNTSSTWLTARDGSGDSNQNFIISAMGSTAGEILIGNNAVVSVGSENDKVTFWGSSSHIEGFPDAITVFSGEDGNGADNNGYGLTIRGGNAYGTSGNGNGGNIVIRGGYLNGSGENGSVSISGGSSTVYAASSWDDALYSTTADDGTDTTAISIDGSTATHPLTVSSTETGFQGIEYAADYSASYGDRSLPDLAFVRSEINDTITTRIGSGAELGDVVTLLADVQHLYSGSWGGGNTTDTIGFSTGDIIFSTRIGGDHDIIIDSVFVVLVGSSPDIDVNLYFDDNYDDATPTTVLTTDLTVTSTTTGNSSVSFSNATVPSGKYLWMTVNEATTQPTKAQIDIYGHKQE